MIHDYFVKIERELRTLESEIGDFIDAKLHSFLKDNGALADILAVTEVRPACVATHGDKKFKVAHSTEDYFYTKVIARIVRPIEVEDFSVPALDVQECDTSLLTQEEKAAISGL